MTAHLHAEFVPGCYRCDLSRDEVASDPAMTCPRCGDHEVYIFGDGWECNNPECGQRWTRLVPGTLRSAPRRRSVLSGRSRATPTSTAKESVVSASERTGESVPLDWVRSDIPHEGDYAHVNRHGDVCFYGHTGRCETRIPAALLASFRKWLAAVPSDPACVEPGGCVTSDGCKETGGCVMGGGEHA